MRRLFRALARRLDQLLPAAPPPLADYLLDPLDQRIVAAVVRGATSLKGIAASCRCLGSTGLVKTRLRFALAALVRRRVLLAEHDAYRLNPDLLRLLPDLGHPQAPPV